MQLYQYPSAKAVCVYECRSCSNLPASSLDRSKHESNHIPHNSTCGRRLGNQHTSTNPAGDTKKRTKHLVLACTKILHTALMGGEQATSMAIPLSVQLHKIVNPLVKA